MNSHEVFIHIHQGCFAGTGAIVRLPQCQWSKPDGYGKISQCITTTKHSKAKTVCIFLGIYCRYLPPTPPSSNRSILKQGTLSNSCPATRINTSGSEKKADIWKQYFQMHLIGFFFFFNFASFMNFVRKGLHWLWVDIGSDNGLPLNKQKAHTSTDDDKWSQMQNESIYMS